MHHHRVCGHVSLDERVPAHSENQQGERVKHEFGKTVKETVYIFKCHSCNTEHIRRPPKDCLDDDDGGPEIYEPDVLRTY